MVIWFGSLKVNRERLEVIPDREAVQGAMRVENCCRGVFGTYIVSGVDFLVRELSLIKTSYIFN